MEKTEQELRIQLAACYRIFDHMGWTEMIFNHITVKLPGDEHHFLINPYGLHYSEVTASNLVKVDIEGNIVEDTDYTVNPAGIVIHTAIHAARPEAHCIAHTHTMPEWPLLVHKKVCEQTTFIPHCCTIVSPITTLKVSRLGTMRSHG
jgi:ribulose-5-phosphate 4-epimerase/fuculose-1-phosphate aldolase